LLLVLTYKDRGVFACCFIIHFRLLISPSSHTCTKELQNAVGPEYITSSSSKSLLQICCEGPFGLVSSPKPFISNEREKEREREREREGEREREMKNLIACIIFVCESVRLKRPVCGL
jgi:hypothetical protein